MGECVRMCKLCGIKTYWWKQSGSSVLDCVGLCVYVSCIGHCMHV